MARLRQGENDENSEDGSSLPSLDDILQSFSGEPDEDDEIDFESLDPDVVLKENSTADEL